VRDVHDWEGITERLRREVEITKKSKAQLAREIGIDSTTLFHYLSGRNFPTLVTLKKICKVLGCDYQDILGPLDE